MEIHEYASLFPMCSDDEVQQLADDIKQNGLRQPIVIDADEKILDGRNRAAACKIAGVDPTYEPYVGTDAEKLSYVCSVNIHRRHLSTAQRAEIAAKISTFQLGDNQHNKKKEGGSNEPPSKPVSTKQAAKLMNVSPASVKRAKAAAKPANAAKVASAPSGRSEAATEPVGSDEPCTERKSPTLKQVSLILKRLGSRTKLHPQLIQIVNAAMWWLTSAERSEVIAKQLLQVTPEDRDKIQRALPTIQKPIPVRYLYTLGECSYEFVHCVDRFRVAVQSGDLMSLVEKTYGYTTNRERHYSGEPEKAYSNVSEIEWSEPRDVPASYEIDMNGDYCATELDRRRFQPRDGGGQYLYFEPGRVCYYDETAMNLILKMQSSEPARNNNEAIADEQW